MNIKDVKVGDIFFHRTRKETGEFTEDCKKLQETTIDSNICLEFKNKEIYEVTFALCDKVEKHKREINILKRLAILTIALQQRDWVEIPLKENSIKLALTEDMQLATPATRNDKPILLLLDWSFNFIMKTLSDLPDSFFVILAAENALNQKPEKGANIEQENYR